jgi:ATP-binding cassette, subfamily C, bacterial
MHREFTTTWYRLLTHICRLYRLRVVLLLALTVLSGLADGLGMALLLPLLNLVGVGSAKDSTIVSGIGQAFQFVGMQPNLETVLGAILLLFLLLGFIVTVQGRMIATIESAYVSHWRATLLERLLSASWPYFAGSRPGSLVFLIITEAERLGRAFFLTIQLIAVLVVAVAYITISLLISFSFTLSLLLSLLLLAALLFRFSSKASYIVGRDYSAYLDELQATLTEFISGAKLIKATAAEPFVLEKVRPIQSHIERNYFSGVIIHYVLKAVMELGAIVLFCVLIYVGVRVLEIQPGVLLVLLAIFFRLVPKLYNAQYNIQLLLTYLPAFQRLEGALDEIDRTSEPYPIDSREKGFVECPAIAMEGVTVTYDERDALSKVSLEIPANTTLGIVGASGVGKSTLVDCLVGLAVPRGGAISFDGVPIGNVNLRQWRSSIGYVAQETVLFNGTIREIICQGRDISDAVMVVAATQAHAHVFIMELPDGYDTVIGGKGVQLSGGQKQRLSLARALAGRPVMLVLDEPTSALDSLSEQEIVAAIRELHGRITIIIVSHRMTTVRDADKIVILDKGRIVGEGGWEALHGSNTLQRFFVDEQS